MNNYLFAYFINNYNAFFFFKKKIKIILTIPLIKLIFLWN